LDILKEIKEYITESNIGKWYIMNASSWLGRKPSIEHIIEEDKPGTNSDDKELSTLFVVNLPVKYYPKKITRPVFIIGSGTGYIKEGTSFPFEAEFVVDTGNGLGKKGTLEVENIITYSQDGIKDTGNGIGVAEKRSTWVFK